MVTAFAAAEDLVIDGGTGRIRIIDDAGEEIDVLQYAADDDAERAWANIAAALREHGWRPVGAWVDPWETHGAREDMRGPRVPVVRDASR